MTELFSTLSSPGHVPRRRREVTAARQRRTASLALAPLLALLFAAAAQAAPLEYKVVKLPPGGGNSSSTAVVNDQGHALVYVRLDFGGFAVFWSPETGYKYIDHGPHGVNAFAMNSHDEVVGLTDAGLGVLWWPDGRTKTFTTPAGFNDMQPTFIDDAGQVVGTLAEAGTGVRHAFHLAPDHAVVVDRPDKTVCPVAADGKGRTVMQTMAATNAGCSCEAPHKDYYVRNDQLRRIRPPDNGALCVFAMDGEGDVLVSDNLATLAMWSPPRGYVPLDFGLPGFDITGMADGGVVAGNGIIGGVYQPFLWSRRSGTQPVAQFLHVKEQLDGLVVSSVSAHGLLGGEFDSNPVILVPSKWERGGSN